MQTPALFGAARDSRCRRARHHVPAKPRKVWIGMTLPGTGMMLASLE